MRVIAVFLISAVLLGYISCSETGVLLRKWEETGYDADSDIIQSIPAYNRANIDYKQNGKSILTVRLEAPAIVKVAARPEKWGFFQFPNIHRTKDDLLVATWSMAADAVESYGNGATGVSVSKDGGKTWNQPSGESTAGGGLELPNGDCLQVYTPKAKKVTELDLPDSVGSNKENYGRTFVYYKMNDLPEELQGVYLNRMVKGSKTWNREHAVLNDPKAVRYTDSGYFPVVWWGDMHVATDKTVVAGIYPGFYLNDKNQVDPSGVLFYRSTDNGHTWDIQGRIPYQYDLATDPNGDKRIALGYTEPASLLLDNGTYLCVMRTTDGLGNSPMYLSRSSDLGVTWTRPVTFTRSGVLPKLLQLGNGVIILASGRPGIQLRFCTDGKGEKWTDPFEMLPFENMKSDVSCGYTEIIPSGPDSFLLIYSDFKYKISGGKLRKAVKVREIKVRLL
ncbi:MAG: glycoside hydrolase [Bacteroidales bacterium]|nr:glycoside hydrolase [Bacteroidales bacterium]